MVGASRVIPIQLKEPLYSIKIHFECLFAEKAIGSTEYLLHKMDYTWIIIFIENANVLTQILEPFESVTIQADVSNKTQIFQVAK